MPRLLRALLDVDAAANIGAFACLFFRLARKRGSAAGRSSLARLHLMVVRDSDRAVCRIGATVAADPGTMEAANCTAIVQDTGAGRGTEQYGGAGGERPFFRSDQGLDRIPGSPAEQYAGILLYTVRQDRHGPRTAGRSFFQYRSSGPERAA